MQKKKVGTHSQSRHKKRPQKERSQMYTDLAAAVGFSSCTYRRQNVRSYLVWKTSRLCFPCARITAFRFEPFSSQPPFTRRIGSGNLRAAVCAYE